VASINSFITDACEFLALYHMFIGTKLVFLRWEQIRAIFTDARQGTQFHLTKYLLILVILLLLDLTLIKKLGICIKARRTSEIVCMLIEDRKKELSMVS